MKKHYFFKIILFLIPVSAFILMASSGGRTDGRTGSPGDGGNTCAACHSGGNFNTSVTITSNIPATGYLLNTAYTINVLTNSTSSTHGFQLTAENNSNTKIGAFTAGTGSRVSGQRITHSTPSTSGNWSFTWTSPSTDLGKVTFYAAVNAANGNGDAFDNADQVVTATTSSPSLSVLEANRLNFDMYPNPASENITIQLPSGSDKASVQFYDYVGRLALSKNITNMNTKVDVNTLSRGVYIIKVVSDSKIGSQKFIKK